MKKAVIIAAVAALFVSGAARADDDYAFTKQTVSEFLAICQSDLKDCYGDVNGADSMAMLESMSNNTDLGYCEPDNMSEEDRGKAVVAWLTQHTEMSSEMFLAGADAAFRALWPCSH